MSQLKVTPIKNFRTEISVPGDKSISHRALMFAGLADGESKVTGFLPSADCLGTLKAMQALGVETEKINPTSMIIRGRNGKLLASGEPLDCGNSGTTMRLMSGILAGQQFNSSLFGDESLNNRPMKRIMEPLTMMGAKILCEGKGKRPPIVIEGKPLEGISYHLPIPSAQLKSCILLAGLQANGKTTVEETIPSRDHTERMLRYMRATIDNDGKNITVHGGQKLNGVNISVPGDFSSAAFWIVAASILPESALRIVNVGLNPTRTGLLNVMMRMGAAIREHIEHNDFEPTGSIRISETEELQGVEIGGNEIPNIIDEIPIIAVAAACAKGQTIIKDAAELRVKESDRLAAVATNLKAFGVPVEETEDGLIIEGGHPIKAAAVKSYGDHRIAMASAILALKADGPSAIENVDCIDTSYPSFTKQLSEISSGNKKLSFALF
ncbi:MAG: 3-phosphoshikimate 1-carboxyvinyltransferase [Verrucomicrobiota bacterium]